MRLMQDEVEALHHMQGLDVAGPLASPLPVRRRRPAAGPAATEEAASGRLHGAPRPGRSSIAGRAARSPCRPVSGTRDGSGFGLGHGASGGTRSQASGAASVPTVADAGSSVATGAAFAASSVSITSPGAASASAQSACGPKRCCT